MKPLNATTRRVLAPYWPGGRHGRLLCGEKAQNSWREGVCILGYAKFLVTGMQLDRSRKIGVNAFAKIRGMYVFFLSPEMVASIFRTLERHTYPRGVFCDLS